MSVIFQFNNSKSKSNYAREHFIKDGLFKYGQHCITLGARLGCTQLLLLLHLHQLHLHRLAAAPSKILPPQLPNNPPLAPCLHPNAPLTQPLQQQFLILTLTPLMPVDTHQLDAKAFPNAASDAHHSLRNQSTFDRNLSKKAKKSVFNVCIRIYPQQIW